MTVKKVILVGLTVLLLESISGYVYLTYQQKDKTLPPLTLLNNPTPIPETATIAKKASISLTSTPSAVKKGANIEVMAHLNTFMNKTSAADLTIKYDPIFLTPQASEAAHLFKPGLAFQKTVFNTINLKQGLATMSAVSDPGTFFSGDDLLTSLAFKTLKTGTTEITIVFTPGETRDTNVVSDTKDILESVENLSLNILP